MNVIDHVIDRIENDIEIEFQEFYKEWKSKKYKKFSECPSYGVLKALIDSSNILRKYIGWDRLSIKNMIMDME